MAVKEYTLSSMHKMSIQLMSVRVEDGHVIARARVAAPEAGARLWIELRFESKQQNAWNEAYDRILSLLEIA